jgi:hypothetical protein
MSLTSSFEDAVKKTLSTVNESAKPKSTSKKASLIKKLKSKKIQVKEKAKQLDEMTGIGGPGGSLTKATSFSMGYPTGQGGASSGTPMSVYSDLMPKTTQTFDMHDLQSDGKAPTKKPFPLDTVDDFFGDAWVNLSEIVKLITAAEINPSLTNVQKQALVNNVISTIKASMGNIRKAHKELNNVFK